MKGIILAVAAFCIVLIGVAVFFASQDSGSGPRIIPLDQSYSNRIASKGWTTGSVSPKVEVLEYGDLQCEACASVSPVITQAIRQTSDIARLTYRHYPLTSMHDKALEAAKVTEAAGRQGKFWEMTELVYANQVTWGSQSGSAFDDLAQTYARTLGLNVEQFKQDMKDSTISDGITSDTAEGVAVSLSHTPTVYINGTELDDIPETSDELAALIRNAAKSNQ